MTLKEVYLSYNPYLVETQLNINGQDIADEMSPFYRYLEGVRLQYWMEPRDGWAGLLGELRSACNSDEIKLTFHGTKLDYQDVEALVNQDGTKHFKRITLCHDNADAAEATSAEAKLKGLVEIFEDIKKGPVEEFHTEEVEDAFNSAMNSDFEIVVIAPMSSGKSTLINAILGRNLLPAINQATTAVITRIRDVDGKKDFTVTAVDHEGNPLCKDGGEIASLARISELNSAIDPRDKKPEQYSEKKKVRALAKEIRIEGDIPNLPAKGLHTVFVDTPGGNNSLNAEHGEVMDDAIQNEDKCMVLYVFNGTQVSTEDNARILKKIADAMRKSAKGKQSRDRFLFVANRMDDVDTDRESYESMVENIKESLHEVGIIDPNLFLVSAQTAKLTRMRGINEPFTESEEDEYDSLCKKMNRKTRQLFEYSTLPESQKRFFRDEIEKRREQHPDEKRDPRIAEINSGVPAVELAISEYLEKYALAIKLKKAQDSFGDIVREKDVIGKAQQRWAESDESFEMARKQADELEKRLENDKSLEDTFASINKIKVDEKPYWDQVQRFLVTFQELTRKYNNQDNTKISINEAKNLQSKLEAEVEPIRQRFREMVDALEDDVTRQCNDAMAEYRKHIETLRKHNLMDIGGIRVDQFASFKKLNRAADIDIKEYQHIQTIHYTVQVKDSGFFSIFKRWFGFGGYHSEKRTKEEERTDFATFARDALGKISESLSDDTRDLLAKANGMVKDIKDRAKRQSEEVAKIVIQAAADFKEKTRKREELQKINDKERVAFSFAQEIVTRVNQILDV